MKDFINSLFCSQKRVSWRRLAALASAADALVLVQWLQSKRTS